MSVIWHRMAGAWKRRGWPDKPPVSTSTQYPRADLYPSATTYPGV